MATTEAPLWPLRGGWGVTPFASPGHRAPQAGKSLYGLGRVAGKQLTEGKHHKGKGPEMALASEISATRLAEAVAEKVGEVISPKPPTDRESVVRLLEEDPGEFNRLYEGGQIPADVFKSTEGKAA